HVPPYLATQPQSVTVTQAQTASFSVVAGGTPTLSYQWYFNGAKMTGSTTNALTLSNVGTNNAGSYTIVVTNSWGSTTSAVATLTVRQPAAIATQPANQAVVQGQTATFSVAAYGDAPLTYQWNFNGTAIAAATNSSLSLSNAQTNQVGNYTVLVANSWGSVTSAVATLTVYVPPFIIGQPQSLTVTQAQNASFSVVANGSATLSYQWYVNGSSLGAGSTNSTLVLTNVGTNNAGNYTVVVTNSWGSVTSAVAALTILVPAGIQTQPTNTIVTRGQAATFSVVAKGTSPYGYQWNFNGANVSGA